MAIRREEALNFYPNDLDRTSINPTYFAKIRDSL